MGAEENAKLVQRGYEAFSAGDMATLTELFADDAVWYVPGSNALSGPKQGRDAILAFFGEMMARSGGTLTVTVDDIVGGENHSVGLDTARATRDTKTLDMREAIVFQIRDGRVTEVRHFPEDTAVNDEFWG